MVTLHAGGANSITLSTTLPSPSPSPSPAPHAGASGSGAAAPRGDSRGWYSRGEASWSPARGDVSGIVGRLPREGDTCAGGGGVGALCPPRGESIVADRGVCAGDAGDTGVAAWAGACWKRWARARAGEAAEEEEAGSIHPMRLEKSAWSGDDAGPTGSRACGDVGEVGEHGESATGSGMNEALGGALLGPLRAGESREAPLGLGPCPLHAGELGQTAPGLGGEQGSNPTDSRTQPVPVSA
ncbi:hypothetical protein T484DRAFT_1846099 [Baffinella frigidus]|nr:hypothetical protein T484DRAFT_1846099 [Cryptophyta sp. CCMP2293]